MKKLAALLTIVLLAIISLGVYWYIGYRTTFIETNFTVSQPDITVEIHNKYTDKRLASFSGTTATVSLRPGTYFYTPKGDIVDETPREFTVSEQGSAVEIKPDYSEGHLAALLTEEKNNIEAVIRNRYPALMGAYSIQPGALYKQGEWYGTILSPNIEPGDIGDIYRVVLKKSSDGTWEILRYPELVLSAAQYPGVPIEVLHAINKQVL